MQLKTSPWQRFVRMVNGHRGVSLGIIIAFLLGSAALVGGALWYGPQLATVVVPGITKKQPMAQAAKTIYRSPLTGVELPDEAATKRHTTGIMIENSLDARPQSGLKEAGVVFEAIAEGGITRYLALYQESRPGLVGPVRSLRPYYVSWLAPFDAPIAHVGGSKNALDEIRNGQYKDIDQFFNGGSYWRANDRVAPHNVYTNFDKLDELNNKKGYTTSTYSGFPRKLDSAAAAPTATKIDVTVSSPVFNSSYTYDKAANNYLRALGGVPHTDREKGQITPKVVIVMKVPATLGFEDGYREQMSTIGTGQAYIFQDGVVHQGLWRKSSQKGQLQFYDTTGKPILLNAGQTWITVVKPDKSVSWQ